MELKIFWHNLRNCTGKPFVIIPIILHVFYVIIIKTNNKYVFSLARRKSKVLMRVLNCCLLNGGVFFVSINLFEYGLLPVLKFLLTWIFGQNSGSGAYVWSWMQPVLSFVFGMIWVMPLFILSRVVNSLWFQVNRIRTMELRVKRTLFLMLCFTLLGYCEFGV